MRPFEYVAPQSLAEALETLHRAGEEARPLAGGTDLLVAWKGRQAPPRLVVDLGRVAELHGVFEAADGLHIGSLTTHTDIASDPLIARHVPAMISAALSIGAPQTRNRGTIGGNLVSAVPSMDSGPVLLAFDARLNLASAGGTRTVAIQDFFLGPRRTVLDHDELLVDVVIPREMLGRPSAFWKFGLRKGQALALVNAAASVAMSNGTITDSRVALGAVAPTVIRSPGAEAGLRGAVPAMNGVVERAASAAVGDARPIDDFRASAGYRRELIAAGVRKVLHAALEGVQS